ncbi:MAG: glycosyltransferase family 2 protein, partial [Bacteroidota bacterium]
NSAHTDIFSIVHNYKTVTEVLHNGQRIEPLHSNMLLCMKEVALSYPHSLIVWVHENLKNQVNYSDLHLRIANGNTLISYHTSEGTVAGERLGYVDWGTFVHVDKSIRYPTWLMSSDVGALEASTLNRVSNITPTRYSFDFDLCLLAKRCMPGGLLCYSDPQLLLNDTNSSTKRQWETDILYSFIATAYNRKWLIMLMLNLIAYERSMHVLSLIKAWFRSKPKYMNFTVQQNSIAQHTVAQSVDVIIPTIGRKKYLLDFLNDLANQQAKVNRVIVVEQNPDIDSQSELEEELQINRWPFRIVHIFTHTTGACQARNTALKQVKSEWVFLADDDIRIPENFISDVFRQISSRSEKVFTLSCLKENETEKNSIPIQWHTFGSGCSFLHNSTLRHTKFNTAYENGFGEDADFGMQLRKKGFDIIYLPTPQILHLKAPIGGFRTPVNHPWQHEPFSPKPSPTIMLYHLLYYTIHQRRGYKIFLFINYFLSQHTFNIISYTKRFKYQYSTSLKWAHQLQQKIN